MIKGYVYVSSSSSFDPLHDTWIAAVAGAAAVLTLQVHRGF